jgi:hypothetical protein
MALSQSQLATDLAEVARNPGSTIPECAEAWAEAISSYASGVTPSGPGMSLAIEGAKATLKTALIAAFASPAAAPLMETAMLAFGVTVGGGMLPLVAVPPVAPVGFAIMFAAQPPPPTHDAAGAMLAGLIDTWMKTGSANTVPPTSPIPWT